MSLIHNTNYSLDEWLRDVCHARVGVFGDFCIDAYWQIDTDLAEISIETGVPLHRVRKQSYSLGGAGNIVVNLRDLGVANVRAIGLVGDDLFGRLMLDLLNARGVNCEGMQSQGDWQTLVYGKPYIGDEEQNRLDFGGFNQIREETCAKLAENLAAAAEKSDVIILNQQVPAGVSTAEMIKRINDVVSSHPRCMFIVDARHRAEAYRGCLYKVNAHEAARLLGEPRNLDERIPADEARALALRLSERAGRSVFVTRGENGIIAVEGGAAHVIPGIQIVGRTDPVGCGDTAVSAIAAMLARGGTACEAATLANIAASVTARKIKMTGSASPDEIRRIGPSPDYVYTPELADDPRHARYYENSEIEIVRDLPEEIHIRHAVFDHDGTISTLREGWEQIMEPMMIRAVLGPSYDKAGEALYHKVVDTVRAFIEKTTGVQTLVQMEGLLELVRQFRCVPESDMLDIHGYKALYNAQLMVMVRQRIDKLRRGELDPYDFMIKGAPEFLERLHKNGIRLYLASGTDQQDVAAEAEALGYAGLFEGRIFGATGDVAVEAKRQLIERIIREQHLNGPAFAVFGDGPVEVREARKHSGIGVGLASDELRRFGLNPVKRSRLIRAGADMVMPDFSRLNDVARLLKIGQKENKS